MQTLFCQVLLPLHLPSGFTYRIPLELYDKVKVGVRVAVQFGKKKIYSGIVSQIHDRVPEVSSVKYILEIIDSSPIINEKTLSFYDWIASYYMCYVGDVISAGMPALLRLRSESKLVVSEEFSAEVDKLTSRQLEILNIVDEKVSISIDEISNRFSEKGILPEITQMVNEKILAIDEQLEEKYKPKLQPYLVLSSNYENAEHKAELIQTLSSKKNTENQLQTFLLFLSESQGRGIVEKSSFQEKCHKGSLQTLIKKQVFEVKHLVHSRLKEQKSLFDTKDITLSASQQKAFNLILDLWKEKDVTLLHGVTGSGKTEIYIKLIERTIKEGKQVLYILPEIALSIQLLSRLEKYFGDKIGIYHSRFSKEERVEIWNKVKENDKEKRYQIIIGSRASIFLPFSELGLIVVDEEHDGGFKQREPAPRYNARDAAIYLASLHKAKVILGSATPSLETYFNTQIEKYGYVQLNERYLNTPMPIIDMANMREEYINKKNYSIFSSLLYDKISQTLANHQQVILFKNQRGYASNIRCNVCGWVAKCPNCDVSLTYHKHLNTLNCHYCGLNLPLYNECPECHSHSLVQSGNGSEKIEEEILRFFPNARVKRMDLDTTRKKNDYLEIIQDFEKGNIDILCGTQIITKGLDFSNVGLVGVIDADSLLYYPDFRAYERCFDLLTQVAGRAGRLKEKGAVVIQSFNPNHQIFKEVLNYDYASMYKNQIVERKLFSYPPFVYLTKILFQSKDKDVLDSLCQEYSNEIRKIFAQRILGPEYPPIYRVKGMYQKQFILKLEKTISYTQAKKMIMQLNEEILSKREYKQVRVIVDVDTY
jgi:primosomal protein N' (replication factor Y)